MVGTQVVHDAARVVRHSAVALALILIVGSVALQSFMSHYSATTLRIQNDCSADAACDGESPLALEITRLESAGFECSSRPSLTDVIVFQRHGASATEILTFDQALAATTARDGWIRRYCVSVPA